MVGSFVHSLGVLKTSWIVLWVCVTGWIDSLLDSSLGVWKTCWINGSLVGWFFHMWMDG